MLVVSLCKPVICKLKMFGVGNLVGGNHKKGGSNFEILMRGRKRGGDTIFDPNLVG